MTPLGAAVLVVLVGSTLLIAHTFVLYPALLYVVSKFVPEERTRAADAELPTVTLIIAAYNEEGVIAEKIENSLALDYPREKLDIVVFSDASSDATDDIVRSYADEGIELRRIEGRVGKTECQNRVAAEADGDILVFSDANSVYEPDAIRKLVGRFDDDVGCVIGELRLTESDEEVAGESVYWKYTRFLKRVETRIGSVVKGNGAIYAVSREDYVPLPADSMSDFAEPLAIRERGRVVKYAPDAVAHEQTVGSMAAERSRKIRITTRSWHTLWQHLELLDPLRYGLYSVQLFTDTVLWWSMPVLFFAVFASAALLAYLTGHVAFLTLVAGYVLFALFGATGWYLSRKKVAVPGPLHLPHYFLSINYSLLVGGWNFLQGRNIVTWETTN